MTELEVKRWIKEIQKKLANNLKLSIYEQCILEQVEDARKQGRKISVREIEEIKFWMD